VCGPAKRDFTQLNTLAEKYGDKLVILGFPCNQFGHQCYDSDFEMLNHLKHVRPGDGYEPKFQLMTKATVNGADEEPMWTFLKAGPHSLLKLPVHHCPVLLPTRPACLLIVARSAPVPCTTAPSSFWPHCSRIVHTVRS
jgi:hypothetical protein